MARKRRRSFAVVLGVLAGGLLAAGLAWACTPSAAIEVTPNAHRSGGADARVSGAHFVPSTPERASEVRIYWNSSAGRLLGTATVDQEGRFGPVEIPIPRAPEDTYTILAVTTGTDGTTYAARASFTIGRSATKVSGGEKSGGKDGATTGAAGNGKTSATIRGATGGSRGDSGARGSGGADRAPASAPTGDADQGVFAGSAAPGDPAAERQGAGGKAGPSGNPALSDRSATGDLWSGFGPGKRSSLGPGAADAAPASGAGPQLAIGLGLLGLGLVALLGGFGVAEARRRRASAGER